MTERISLIKYYEKLPVAIYVCDRNDELVDFNTAAATLFDTEPLTGSQDWYPTLNKFDHNGRLINENYRPVSIGIKANTEGYRQEIRFRLPDGSERHILVSSVAMWDSMGNYDGAVHTLSDVTALRDSEKQQALLAAIVSSSQDAIIAKDFNGFITSWNPAAERLFGYSSKEAIGKHISLIIPEDRIEEEKYIIQNIRAGQTVAPYETVRVTKTGILLPISITVSPIRDRHGVVIGASKIARDITAQKKAEKALKEYTIHLEDMVVQRTQQLEEALIKEKELGDLKSRFVSMASHEFRTPLSTIQLSASLLSNYAAPYQNGNIDKHVEKIKAALNSLKEILSDFLSLEKIESGKVTANLIEFDLVDCCKEITEEMQLLSKKGQQIKYLHHGVDTNVRLDPNLLKHCVLNLLSNAIKYSAENTEINMETAIALGLFKLSVADAGIGIPDIDKPNLLAPFFRATNTGTIQGTGLGLNIVARYTELMGGNIDFESIEGKGSKFILSFPLS